MKPRQSQTTKKIAGPSDATTKPGLPNRSRSPVKGEKVMGRKQLPLPGVIVKKSNALARAVWHMDSIWQPRLIALVASKVQEDDEDFRTFEIPISEILDKTQNTPGGKNYEHIAQAAVKLMQKVIDLPHNPDDPNSHRYKWRKAGIFSYAGYREKEGIVELRFDPAMMPHYLNLKKKFLKYGLFEFLRLGSEYSQMLFEYLKSWSSVPEIETDMEQLYLMLDVPTSLRKDFRNFRVRVLEPAHKEITAKTSLDYLWEPIKRGRTVVAIRFKFGDEAPAKHRRTKNIESLQLQETAKRHNELAGLVAICRAKGNEEAPEDCPRRRPKTIVCKTCSRMHGPKLF